MKRLKNILLGPLFFLIGCGGANSEEDIEFRMKIQDVFYIATNPGPTVTGKIEMGTIKLGDQIVLLSAGTETIVKVVGLEKFREIDLKEIVSGHDDVGVTIKGVAHDQVKTGDILRQK